MRKNVYCNETPYRIHCLILRWSSSLNEHFSISIRSSWSNLKWISSLHIWISLHIWNYSQLRERALNVGLWNGLNLQMIDWMLRLFIYFCSRHRCVFVVVVVVVTMFLCAILFLHTRFKCTLYMHLQFIFKCQVWGKRIYESPFPCKIYNMIESLFSSFSSFLEFSSLNRSTVGLF